MVRPSILRIASRAGPASGRGFENCGLAIADWIEKQKSPQRAKGNREAPYMTVQLTHITLGVSDLTRSKKFYTDMGCAIANDYGVSVFFKPGEGMSFFGLYGRDALAAEAGVDPKGSGFPGVTMNYLVSTSKQVDEVLAQAKSAGGKIVKEAHKPQWGGYLGYFADPDGYLWKVASA